MSQEDWLNDRIESRQEAVRKTIRPATFEELVAHATERFPIATDPWYDRYMSFLKEHKGGSFYRAETPEHAEVIYCKDTKSGVWFLPGKGMGILQPRGLKLLEQIVASL